MSLFLTESRRLRLASFTTLYLAQGFPFGLVFLIGTVLVWRTNFEGHAEKVGLLGRA